MPHAPPVCPQRVEHREGGAVTERPSTAAELIEVPRPGKGAGGPFGHCGVVMSSKIHAGSSRLYRPVDGRAVVLMIDIWIE
jgi:hypothetical protein